MRDTKNHTRKKGCLIIGAFKVDCRNEIDPMTKGMLLMWAVFSEMERDIISSRVKSGMYNAKLKGAKIGRPKLTKEKIPDRFFKLLELHNQGELTITDISELMKVSRKTVYKWEEILK